MSELADPARRPPIPIEGPAGAADAPPASRSDPAAFTRRHVVCRARRRLPLSMERSSARPCSHALLLSGESTRPRRPLRRPNHAIPKARGFGLAPPGASPVPGACLCTASGLASRAALLLLVRYERLARECGPTSIRARAGAVLDYPTSMFGREHPILVAAARLQLEASLMASAGSRSPVCVVVVAPTSVR